MKDTSINKIFRLSWVLFLIYLIERPLFNNRALDVIVMILPTLSFFSDAFSISKHFPSAILNQNKGRIS